MLTVVGCSSLIEASVKYDHQYHNIVLYIYIGNGIAALISKAHFRVMGYDIRWVIPTMRHPSKLWYIASSLTIACAGIVSKILLEYLNNTKVHHREIMIKALEERPKHMPLVTVSNHNSCFDDPGLWGTLTWKTFLIHSQYRWSLAAHDICFTKAFHALMFMLGKGVPVMRGYGVFQPAIDFCIEKLKEGSWVHVFPEGKINMTKSNMRLKWGVGRMIYESPVTPIIIPIWHIGMDDMLPNRPPYIPRLGKKITLNFGRPLDLRRVVEQLKLSNATKEYARKVITDIIQAELVKLKEETEKLHYMSLYKDTQKS